MMHEADDDDDAAAPALNFPEYVSFWCALDDCSASNGTLAFAMNTQVLEIDCSNNTMLSGNKRKYGHHGRIHGLSSFTPDTETKVDTSNWGPGSPMIIRAGTAVLFSSRTWYTINSRVSYAHVWL
jgi:ectoine hydroxylase-related dioxygenase (phytanoyl-CoA dioxygenase family)